MGCIHVLDPGMVPHGPRRFHMDSTLGCIRAHGPGHVQQLREAQAGHFSKTLTELQVNSHVQLTLILNTSQSLGSHEGLHMSPRFLSPWPPLLVFCNGSHGSPGSSDDHLDDNLGDSDRSPVRSTEQGASHQLHLRCLPGSLLRRLLFHKGHTSWVIGPKHDKTKVRRLRATETISYKQLGAGHPKALKDIQTITLLRVAHTGINRNVGD